MAILTFPSRFPSSITWSLQSNTQAFESPFNKTTQVLEMAGARWMASLQFPVMSPSDAREMMAFLVSLRGEAGRFYLYDHSLVAPQGIATGVPVVAGASQSGSLLNTSDWTVSTAILKAGDWIGVGDELKMVIEDISSDASGLASIKIEPPIRTSPANLSAIVIDKPTAIMRMSSDTASWSIATSLHYSTTIDCVEVF